MPHAPARVSPQLAQEETDLVRKELSITQERLEVCSSASRGHQSREHTCAQDLELARAEARAAQARVADAEAALRQNDCAAARKELRAYKERAEASEAERESLGRR